ncbi:MAG: tRNA (guanosine(37)-N1)-methyltransferase TrmD [Chloroflexota bacterium]
MRIDIVTLFPDMFDGPFRESIIKRAIDNRIVEIALHNLREHGLGRHRVVDDYPHGGGAGMVMRPEPLFDAVESVGAEPETPVILLTPQGRPFHQQVAEELAAHARILLVCGHYEGVDERVREHLVTDEISIGDYVLTGGELAAMVVVDAVVRQLPGVLGSEDSVKDDSHADGLLEYPQYTRPQSFRGWEVPSILLSGNHAEIAKWRRQQAILRTLARRPALLENAQLSEEERRMVEKQID